MTSRVNERRLARRGEGKGNGKEDNDKERTARVKDQAESQFCKKKGFA